MAEPRLIPWMLVLCLSLSFPGPAAAESPLERAGQALAQESYAVTLRETRHGLAALPPTGEEEDRAALLHLQGMAYQGLGFFPEAEQALREAARHAAVTPGQADDARILGALGDLALASGQEEAAARHLQQGLALARHEGQPRLLVPLLLRQANLLTVRGEALKGEELYREGLALAGELDDPLLLADLHHNLAFNALHREEFTQAAQQLSAAREALGRAPPSSAKGRSLVSLARLTLDLVQADPARAAALLPVALALAREGSAVGHTVGDATLRSHALGFMGALYEGQEQTATARQLTRQALFHAHTRNAPELLTLWEWQLGRLALAEGALEEAVAHLRQAVAILGRVRQDFSTGWRATRDPFRTWVTPVYAQLADLLLRQADREDGAESRQALYHEAQETLESLKTAEVRNLFHDECLAGTAPAGAAPLRLPPATAVLYPILLPDRMELLLSLPGDTMEKVSVPVKRRAMEEEARRFRVQLQEDQGNGYLPHAQRLHQWLLAPLASLLQRAGITTLVVVPDGILRTIPLAALHDGERFVAERLAVVVTPSLRLTDPRRVARGETRIMVSGLSKGVQGFQPLPNVPREVALVSGLFPSRVLLDDRFTVPRAMHALEETPFSIVHIASHGQFHHDPRKTFLLAYDDKLTMDRLEQMVGLARQGGKPVELLTLSACQTAVGDEQAALGLAGVAVKAGARSALASLWFIDDAATTRLISAFYRELAHPEVTKALALQRAQQQLIADPATHHPGLWAAFILIGNWM